MERLSIKAAKSEETYVSNYKVQFIVDKWYFY